MMVEWDVADEELQELGLRGLPPGWRGAVLFIPNTEQVLVQLRLPRGDYRFLVTKLSLDGTTTKRFPPSYVDPAQTPDGTGRRRIILTRVRRL